MGKSLKNVVTPDDMFRDYGADTLRLYEMYMGPLEARRARGAPATSSACTGSSSACGATWSTRTRARCVWPHARRRRDPAAAAQDDRRRPRRHGHARLQHRDRQLITLNNRLTQVAAERARRHREVVEPFVLMLAPLAPHIAEELWSRLGHDATLTYEDCPVADPQWLVEDSVEFPVQVNGKVRGKVTVAGADGVLMVKPSHMAVDWTQAVGTTIEKRVSITTIAATIPKVRSLQPLSRK